MGDSGGYSLPEQVLRKMTAKHVRRIWFKSRGATEIFKTTPTFFSCSPKDDLAESGGQLREHVLRSSCYSYPSFSPSLLSVSQMYAVCAVTARSGAQGMSRAMNNS